MKSSKVATKSKKSLRTVLLVNFILFSVTPLAFITGFSLVNYQKAFEAELSERLQNISREFEVNLDQYTKYFSDRADLFRTNTTLLYALSENNVAALQQAAKGYQQNSISGSTSFFNRAGLMVARASSQTKPLPPGEIYISEEYQKILDEKGSLRLVDRSDQLGFDLVFMARLQSKTGKTIGYSEEYISLGPQYFENLKKRTNAEVGALSDSRELMAASHKDFWIYPKNFFSEIKSIDSQGFFSLSVAGVPYRFLVSKEKWGDSNFYVFYGASKERSQFILKRISVGLISVLLILCVLIIASMVFITRRIMRPIQDLTHAIQRMRATGSAISVQRDSDTELGVVVESFNEMSSAVGQARRDLERKVAELGRANAELKATQDQLVQSAKMASLGQVVAGVAHELNNPIGFIYSNISTLQDYVARLTKLIEIAEKNPSELESKKRELDYEFLRNDIPKLIASCRDGSERIREIVMGLKTFSWRDETQLKPANLHESLDATINLLSGELRGRIEVERRYGSLPLVHCQVSQINQVFMNILVNAIQAISGTGKITISTKVVGQHAVVSIRDSGVGINPEDRGKLFDPFFSTKSVGEGTGLGLSISYGIVEKHGGRIEVDSQPGQGSEFRVYLPISPS